MNIFQPLGTWLSAWSRRQPATKSDIERIEMTTVQLLVGLQALKEQADKSKAELVAAVVRLNDSVASLEAKVAALNEANQINPEIHAAFDALKSSIQAIDDLNADEPVVGEPSNPHPDGPGQGVGLPALDPVTPAT